LEPTIAELARQLKVVSDSLKNSDGEIALAKAEARAARKAAEASSLKSQLQIAEVEAEAQAARRTAQALQAQLDAVDAYKKSVPVFQNRGNEIQYNHNTSVVNDLMRALTALELGAVDDVDRYIRKSVSALLKRNNCIRIAEESPYGWATVDEYLRSELASDDEDDRKLKRAELTVENRSKRTATARGKGRGGFTQRGKYTQENNQGTSTESCCDSQNCTNPHCTSRNSQGDCSNNSGQNSHGGASKTGYSKPLGPCYYCQEFGHL
jgi:hypothetical protein